MPSTMKKQNGGSACGARNNTKKMSGGGAGVAANNLKKMGMKGGSACGASKNNTKMTGGASPKNNTKMMMTGGSACGASAKNNTKMTGGASPKNNTKMSGGASKSKSKYGPNEGWCMNCGRADKSKGRVTMVNPKDSTKKTTKRTMKMRVGTCPNCGGKVYKIVGN